MKQHHWKSPSIKQIAQEAAVSPATVDRVLNGREGVREVTRKKVADAMQRLGLNADTGNPSANRTRIAIICESGSSFLHQVEQQVRAAINDYPQLHFSLDSVPNVQFNAERFSQLITRRAATSSGIILVCRDEVKINRAVKAAIDDGVPVICLTSDLPNSRRSAYVGIDQVAAGATAGWFMGRMLPAQQSGNILLICSSTYRTQEEREIGFRRVLREAFPWLNIRDRVNINDEAETAYLSVKKWLERGNPLAGIYNTAGGNEGVARALTDFGVQDQVIFIGHELSEASRLLLENGTLDLVLGHDIRREIDLCLALLQQPGSGQSFSDSKIPLLTWHRYSYFA
ncbi:MAG: LacI family DNA-binding transcriptional regulator [Pantoea sp.]|uniref:LacI family DNA-binding transcriptional regulator n=1 Tax=Pantoea sp. TaxID=69393 RepID=UPI0039E22404